MKAFDDQKNANIVVYDRLASREILDLVPSQTMRIYIRKTAQQLEQWASSMRWRASIVFQRRSHIVLTMLTEKPV